MLTPLAHSAGPIGGAGLAWPPLHCSFTKALISFAILIIFGFNELPLKHLARWRFSQIQSVIRTI